MTIGDLVWWHWNCITQEQREKALCVVTKVYEWNCVDIYSFQDKEEICCVNIAELEEL